MPGILEMRFVNIGQGDFCMIRCPDDKVVVVDCGSTANLNERIFESAREVLRLWLKGKTIHALILTHPDRDHYNKVIRLFFKPIGNILKPELEIDTIFFSKKKSDYAPLGWYTKGGFSSLVMGGAFGTPLLREVTINKNIKKCRNWRYKKENNGYQHLPEEEIINGNCLVVAEGKTEHNTKWSIKIIAGNIESTYMDDGRNLDPNSSSLVTFIQLGNDRALLTGDATKEVQDYLIEACEKDKTLEGMLSKLGTLQIPHHGSKLCAPKEKFLELLSPRSLVVSVDLQNDGYHLPRFSVIEKWIEKTGVTKKIHTLTTGKALMMLNYPSALNRLMTL